MFLVIGSCIGHATALQLLRQLPLGDSVQHQGCFGKSRWSAVSALPLRTVFSASQTSVPLVVADGETFAPAARHTLQIPSALLLGHTQAMKPATHHNLPLICLVPQDVNLGPSQDTFPLQLAEYCISWILQFIVVRNTPAIRTDTRLQHALVFLHELLHFLATCKHFMKKGLPRGIGGSKLCILPVRLQCSARQFAHEEGTQ